LKGPILLAISTFAVVAALFHLCTTEFGALEPREMRSVHLLFLIPLVFLLFPATPKAPGDRIPWYDYLLAALGFVANGYSFLHAERIVSREQGVTEVLPIEVILGTIMVILLIEASRRILSKWFAILPILFLAYLALSSHISGLLHFKSYSYARIIEMLYLYPDEGIYGSLTGLSSNILFMYAVLAVFIIRCGVADYLIELAYALVGGMRGGQAKVAVIASALYGCISGSTVANVYATGSITIPLMKKTGYHPKTAGAIEAAASAGGQLMPPIMGIGAFVIAELTDIPYSQIIIMAALPALLYYLGIMTMVHFEAVKDNLLPETDWERPDWRDLAKRSYMALPFILIAFLLITGYSPAKAAFYVTLLTALLGFINPQSKINAKTIRESLSEGAVTAAQIAVALGSASIMVTIMIQTEAALSFSHMIVNASGGVLPAALIIIFLAVLLLGTSIPTTAAYLIAITVVAGALGEFGVPAVAAHLFVFNYAVMSDLTPPFCVSAFAAASLSGAEMVATGLEAFRLSLSGFVVPFVFVFNPALLAHDTPEKILLAVILTGLAVFCISIALVGCFRGKINIYQRILLGIAAVLLVVPLPALQTAGLVAAVAGLVWIVIIYQPAGAPVPYQNIV
jgi:TRAP transporter 4TM/12TM fusion protein